MTGKQSFGNALTLIHRLVNKALAHLDAADGQANAHCRQSYPDVGVLNASLKTRS